MRPTLVVPAVVHQVVAAVGQRGGLRLPKEVSVHFVDAPSVAHRGQTIRRPNGTFDVYLSAHLGLDDLWLVVAHESMHLHDLHSGWPWTRIELEMRAVRFQAQAMSWAR